MRPYIGQIGLFRPPYEWMRVAIDNRAMGPSAEVVAVVTQVHSETRVNLRVLVDGPPTFDSWLREVEVGRGVDQWYPLESHRDYTRDGVCV